MGGDGGAGQSDLINAEVSGHSVGHVEDLLLAVQQQQKSVHGLQHQRALLNLALFLNTYKTTHQSITTLQHKHALLNLALFLNTYKTTHQSITTLQHKHALLNLALTKPKHQSIT